MLIGNKLFELKISKKKYFYKLISIFFSVAILSCVLTILSLLGIRKKYEINFFHACISLSLIFFIYLFLMKRLTYISITEKESKVYIRIEYYTFMFFLKSKNDLISQFQYSYEMEKTSSLHKERILRIYHHEKLIVKSGEGYDGFTKKEIQSIVSSFENIKLEKHL